jgi:predicted ABC-type ATPase
MTEKKQLWMLVGGNGAGKSTFYKHYLEPAGVLFINADNIARHCHPKIPNRLPTKHQESQSTSEKTCSPKAFHFVLKLYFRILQKLTLWQMLKLRDMK